jgi:hypothetical protein
VSARAAPGPPGGLERRRTARVTPDELAEPVSVVGARLLDISRDGLLLEAPVPLASQSTLRLRLVVGGVKTELETRVASSRCRGLGGSRPWGVGVEFTDVPADVRERLTRALGTWRAKPRTA